MDKYTMFKNFMHNELDVSKEDIKKWTKEAITQVAENHVKHQLNTKAITDKIIQTAVRSPYSSDFVRDIQRSVSKALSDQLEIRVK